MIFTGKFHGVNRDMVTGDIIVSFATKDKETVLGGAQDLRDMDLEIDAKKYRKKRSLDANAYFWQLADKIAKRLNQMETGRYGEFAPAHTKDTVYDAMLKKYGVFEYLVCREKVVPELLKTFRTVEVVGKIKVGEASEGVQVRCYWGSSMYNSKEMSDLINGTVSDAKELGIETLPPAEIEAMMEALREREKKKQGV